MICENEAWQKMASGKQRFQWGDEGGLKATGGLDMRRGRVPEPSTLACAGVGAEAQDTAAAAWQECLDCSQLQF